jgi:hypothetical protein
VATAKERPIGGLLGHVQHHAAGVCHLHDMAGRGDLISGTRDRHLAIVTLWSVNHELERERAWSRRCPREGLTTASVVVDP